MAVRKVIWSRTAARQRRNILEFWKHNNQSHAYSLRVLQQSNDKTSLIAENPEIYPQSEFPNMRVAHMGNFSIYYLIREKEILITAFWDNRQNPDDIVKYLKSHI